MKSTSDKFKYFFASNVIAEDVNVSPALAP
jgi:hypothetical protein